MVTSENAVNDTEFLSKLFEKLLLILYFRKHWGILNIIKWVIKKNEMAFLYKSGAFEHLFQILCCSFNGIALCYRLF